MEVGDETTSNKTEIINMIESKIFEFSPHTTTTQSKMHCEPPGDENHLEFLTQENIDKTFNADCYRLFYNNSSLCITQNHSQFNYKKIVEEQMSKLVEHEVTQSFGKHDGTKLNATRCVEMPHVTLNCEQIILNNVTIKYDETSCVPAKSETILMDSLSGKKDTDSIDSDVIDTTLDSSSIYSTTNTKALNETVFSAIRNPFDCDIKNRLLTRSVIDLNERPNYKKLLTNAPLVKEKHPLTLNDKENYLVLEEIGKGAFAKIYLIQNNKKGKEHLKYALKVSF